jgi:probable HAF family extracellular repeat protein
MKPSSFVYIAAVTLFCGSVMPIAAAQTDRGRTAPKHHHYQPIDMGTFGGPASSTVPLWLGTLNNQGMTIGWSATSTPVVIHPGNPFICGGLDAVVPYVTHAFQWDGSVSDLGTLRPGDDNCSLPFWVSDDGAVVGTSEDGHSDPLFGFNRGRAVLWKDGQISDLGTLGGYEAAAFATNSRGQIVGDSTNATPNSDCFFFRAQLHAFLWQSGQMQDLGTLGGNCSSIGFANIDAAESPLNELGQVIGISTTSSVPNPATGLPTWDPFLWEEGKGMTDLGTLGGAYGGAQGINNRGQVIGQSSIASDPGACNGFPDNANAHCHAFLWENGTMTDLTTTTIGGHPSIVKNINDLGEIVGDGSFPAGPNEAFLWKNGVATDLGHLGDCFSGAQSINSHSQVVGSTSSCDGTIVRAYLWEQGSMVNLETLIPANSSLHLATAGTINDRGEINGIGVPLGIPVGDWVTEGHSFLLIPCDENHPGIAECDYSLVDGTEQPITHPTAASQPVPPQMRQMHGNQFRVPRQDPFNFPTPQN